MTTRETNLKKKRLPCLKCGRIMHTTRCHRLCKRCAGKNRAIGKPRVVHAAEPTFRPADETPGHQPEWVQIGPWRFPASSYVFDD